MISAENRNATSCHKQHNFIRSCVETKSVLHACGFIEMNIGAGVDAKEGGNQEVGIAREVHLGVSVVRQIGMGVEVGVRVVGEKRDGV